MRIETIPQTPARLLADSRSPTSSFVDMVSHPGTGGGDGSPQGALGFQALGMFGRYQAIENTGATAPSLLQQPSPETSVRPALSMTGRPGASIMIERAGSSGSRVSSGKPAQETSVQAVRRALQTGAPTADGAPGIETAVPDIGSEDSMTSSAVRSGARKSPGPPEARIRLALFKNGSGVAVAVTAPGLSACDIQRFRERAETLLRDHGIVLDNVAVNGEGRVRGDASRGSSEQWR